jgi:hypothetical protein
MNKKKPVTADKDLELDGRLVYLTQHVDVWLRQMNPQFRVPMVNRIAKIVKVFDWESPEGKLLLKEREKTGKWTKLDPKAFKYVLKVYLPEVIAKTKDKEKKGVTVEEMMPRYYPGTDAVLFEPLPVWMLTSLQKEEKNLLKILESTKSE